LSVTDDADNDVIPETSSDMSPSGWCWLWRRVGRDCCVALGLPPPITVAASPIGTDKAAVAAVDADAAAGEAAAVNDDAMR